GRGGRGCGVRESRGGKVRAGKSTRADDVITTKTPKTASQPDTSVEARPHTRTGLTPEILSRAIIDNLHFVLGRHRDIATPNEWFRAVAYTVRDRLMDRWIKNVPALINPQNRTVAYLSAEF